VVKTVLTIVGARPQFIKAAAVSRHFHGNSGLREVLVHTGQHFDREMSEVFFDELGLSPPAHNLGVHGGQHGEMTGRMMIEIEKVVEQVKPHAVMVYGDTNSTLAGALVAAKSFIPLAHVEAGLRSFRQMPEEVNRVLVDRVSRWLFCPTSTSVLNLAGEGIREGVHQVGDVMYDVTLSMIARAKDRAKALGRLGLSRGSFDLATIHRAENTDSAEALATVVAYLRARAREFPIVLPLHPRTAAAVARFGLNLGAVKVIEPLGYLDMTALLAACREVLTDSGGVQKEAYFHRKPCVTLRDATEWVETIAAGWNRLWHGPPYSERQEIAEYGDGQAGARILEVLQRDLAGDKRQIPAAGAS